MSHVAKSRLIGLLLVNAALCTSRAGLSAFGQPSPATANREPVPKATLVDGQPALALDYDDGMGFLIVYSSWQGKPALRFSVAHSRPAVFPHLYSFDCGGFLWISKDEIAYSPKPTNPEAKRLCTSRNSGMFDLPRMEFSDISFRTDFYSLIDIKMRNDKLGFSSAYFVYKPRSDRTDYNFKDDKVNVEVQTAETIAGRWLKLAFDDFPTAERQFLAGLALPLSASQSATIASAERTAEADEQAGNNRTAFDVYTSTLANLPPNAIGTEIDSLRDRILKLAPTLTPPPTIADEAQRYFFGSQAALQEWKDKGDLDKLDDAIEQLNEALRIASWWPEAYFNRGLVLEYRGRYADAVDSLKLYLLADPNAIDAQQVKQKIYMLEYKAKEADGQK